MTVTEQNTSKRRPVRVNPNKIPEYIKDSDKILKIIANSPIPKNYNFEIFKTIFKIRKLKCSKVALQMPEGLLLFACSLIQIFESVNDLLNSEIEAGILTEETDLISTEFVILGNVAYGACCVDDFSAGALDCDLLIHYGHSCLVPITQTDKCENVLYVFVDIKIDSMHFIKTVEHNFRLAAEDLLENPSLSPENQQVSTIFNPVENLQNLGITRSKIKTVALMGTVQFAATLQTCAKELENLKIFEKVVLPQARPLSKGEVLGCTSPKFSTDEIDLVIFISDGRFHIESTLIMNPNLPILKYNPYDKKFTQEKYNHLEMKVTRKNVIQQAIDSRLKNPEQPWVIFLSTLGRQGNPKILDNILAAAEKINLPIIPVLMAEIQPEKLKNFTDTAVFIQIGCPRLSIDWGPDTVEKPLLTPYEAMICIDDNLRPEWYLEPNDVEKIYPMDFYSYESTGNWTNNHKDNIPERKSTRGGILAHKRVKKVINI